MYDDYEFKEKKLGIGKILATLFFIWLSNDGLLGFAISAVCLLLLSLSWSISKKSTRALKIYGTVVFIFVLVSVLYNIAIMAAIMKTISEMEF